VHFLKKIYNILHFLIFRPGFAYFYKFLNFLEIPGIHFLYSIFAFGVLKSFYIAFFQFFIKNSKKFQSFL